MAATRTQKYKQKRKLNSAKIGPRWELCKSRLQDVNREKLQILSRSTKCLVDRTWLKTLSEAQTVERTFFGGYQQIRRRKLPDQFWGYLLTFYFSWLHRTFQFLLLTRPWAWRNLMILSQYSALQEQFHCQMTACISCFVSSWSNGTVRRSYTNYLTFY